MKGAKTQHPSKENANPIRDTHIHTKLQRKRRETSGFGGERPISDNSQKLPQQPQLHPPSGYLASPRWPWRSTNPKISQNKSNRFRSGKRGGKKMDSTGFDAVGNGRGEGENKKNMKI